MFTIYIYIYICVYVLPIAIDDITICLVSKMFSGCCALPDGSPGRAGRKGFDVQGDVVAATGRTTGWGWVHIIPVRKP